MSYLSLFTPYNLALLNDWLEETGELYVDVYWPHSGGSSTPYFVRSMNDLKALVSQQPWPREISFTIFQKLQYALRGIADNKLLEQALQQIPDGEYYSIVSLEAVYPSRCMFLDEGKSHVELRRGFSEVIGQRVGLGQNPYDLDDEWFRAHRHERFELWLKRTPDYYEPYTIYPERYQSLIDSWRE
jgi:hypothetical protein